ncbi:MULTISPECIES: hypothetical protein [Aeromonas]|uniref:hypothetical protein n=1 Tax=Aeromonas TaxID=642 RepID=UPI002B4A86F4|nr:hypothetical protein [Aeromonas hydrophila]
MSAAQLKAELTALLGDLDRIDLAPEELRAITTRIERMMPDLNGDGAALAI